MADRTATRAERLLVEAALRWRRNRAECKRLADSTEPCEEEQRQWVAGDYSIGSPPVPCWKRYVYIDSDPEPDREHGVPLTVHRKAPLCPSCKRNEESGTVRALRRARRQKGPYAATLSRMAATVLAEREKADD